MTKKTYPYEEGGVTVDPENTKPIQRSRGEYEALLEELAA